MDYVINNRHKGKCQPNTVWDSKHFGKFKVVGQLDTCKINNKGYKYYPEFLIEFTDGTQIITTYPSITMGEVKNPMTPTVYEVGYIGVGKHSPVGDTYRKKTQSYKVWSNMLRRVYGTVPEYHDACYDNVTVDPRWHNFQNFCEDIKELENYSAWLKEGTSAYHLDKDKKQEEIEYKIYSKDTCWFCPAHINLSTRKK